MFRFISKIFARVVAASEPANAGPGPRLSADHFGFLIERRPTPPGVMAVRNLDEIADIFQRDAIRQQSQSVFFRKGASPPLPTNDSALGHDTAASNSDDWFR